MVEYDDDDDDDDPPHRGIAMDEDERESRERDFGVAV